jgi:hypothetical protein
MKFTLIAVAAAAIGLHPNNGVMGSSIVDRHVKSMTATRLFPGAQYGIDVDASEKSWSEIVNTRADRSFGRAWLEKRFIREMQEFGGVYSSDLSSGDALTKMRVTHIVKTSEWHTDGIVGGGRLSAGSSQQGFYVLNDNPHAYFETDDDELCIPFVRGSFLAFNGRKPHRTVINDGSVDLLGPFDLPSLKCVDVISLTLAGLGAAFLPPIGFAVGQYLANKAGAALGFLPFRNLNLEEDGAALKKLALVGNVIDPNTNETVVFFATNTTKGDEFNLGFSDSDECSDEAHNYAKIVNFSEGRTISTDDVNGGWHFQRVTEIKDDENSTVPTLTDYIAGVESKYTLVSYLYGPEKDLLACAHLKKYDEDYREFFKSLAEADADDAGTGGATDTSSGSKNGVFVFVSAMIAAVGIAVVFYVLAL